MPLLLFLVIAVLPLLGTAATDGSDTRYSSLGHRVMCACDAEPAAMGPKGCRQVLLECTHDNCEVSRRIRRELSAALQKGDTDDMVLDSFVKEYGTGVLVKAPAVDKLFWLVALVAVTAVVSFVVACVRKRRPAIDESD